MSIGKRAVVSWRPLPAPAARDAIDVGALIDSGRCGAAQVGWVALAALTIVFDGIDNQLLGVSIPSIMAEWGVARGAFAPVVAVGFLGMMLGGLAAGAAGDRVGRRTALLGSVVVFGAATLLVTLADSVPALAVLRLVAGLGLGGAMPNAAALAAEYVPLRQRAVAVTMTIVCVPLGGTLAGLIAIPALPAFGWRGLFLAGGVVPLVAALVLWRLMPESPRFLARRRERWAELGAVLRRMGHPVPDDAVFAEETETRITRAPLAALFERAWLRDTLGLWLAFFSCLLSVYMGFSWLPSILAGAGLGAAVASAGITAFNLGGVAGAVGGGVLIRRFGSRATMLTMTLVAIAGAVALSQMSITKDAAVPPIILMLVLTGGMINGVQTTMYALAAHVYPTAMRATGVGTAVSIGRSGAIISGYTGPWALEYRGSQGFFGVMAAALALTFLSLAAVKRHVPRSARTA
jgi:AAHS family 4-hydroxybenzoate transporter-like MFS transporter